MGLLKRLKKRQDQGTDTVVDTPVETIADQLRDEAIFAQARERYLARLAAEGIPEPGAWLNPKRKPATVDDIEALYAVNPSFVDMLPWTEYLPQEQAMLLEDGKSLAAFYELTPIGTEGRDPEWLRKARDALENALQDSFDELDESPWVVQ
ncbi:TraC family protein, partial [Pseudomonas syringae group genomosp. 3]